MRRLAALVLLVALAGGLTACGKKANLKAPEGALPNAPTAPKPNDTTIYPGSS